MPTPDLTNIETLLKEEYFHLQNTIESFDSKSITIKAWSISGSLVVMGAGFTDKGSNELFLVASFASLLFWYIEGIWKAFQQSFYDRVYTIEDHFNAEIKKPIQPLQLSHFWSKRWHGKYKKGTFKVLFWPHVMLPHVFVFLGGIAIYLLATYHIINLRANI
ncbi:hypothetical protein [Mucilaginibacter celer]|uniref:DUF2270 domain-containing protein n=1 Tax=Mucilaginibacter celer TaxID=2305508 RepID=A0A494VLT9_9SPHI|nr:hypothetical protein [Mucilaginibacter celer]AYL94581.1 hypothetical protein HYN43_004380 [Mucilaginibacter celer]